MQGSWIWLLAKRHLSGKASRPAVKWMNGFAFLGLSLSVFAWVSILSIMTGMQNQIRDKILLEKPHLLWEGRPRSGAQALAVKVRAEVGDDLKRAETYLRSEALVERFEAGSGPDAPVLALGRQRGAILEGRDEIVGDRADVGVELASQLEAGENDQLRVRSAWALEQFPLRFTVTGVFESGLYEMDKTLIRVSRRTLGDWLGLDDAYSYLSIQLKDPERSEAVRDRLRASLDLPLKTWQEADSALWYSLKMEKTVMGLAVFFVVLLSSFALYMAMSVRLAEKSTEMALLRGLGATREQLQRLFLIEGAILGFCAVLVGIVASYAFCLAVSGWVHLPTFYYSTSIPVSWSWTRTGVLGVTVFVLALVSTWLPVRRGFAFSVAETLRS
ncbi:MAG: FtsX-like permease family protein [Bdellovibrionota bacterium]